MQPGELLVIDYQAEKLARIHFPMQALVLAAFHIQQRLVQAQQRQAQSDEFLACWVRGAASVS
jgi:hypothetical protein